jgi:3-carboxy-cis,cis-muconate cycloisomerase
MFSTAAMSANFSGHSWVASMLRVESALAAAGERAGVVPADAAAAIRSACEALAVDPAALGAEGAKSATPVVPLVEALRRAVPRAAAGYVHLGATSQDIIDTALMLLVREGLDLLLGDLNRASGAAAALAERHRETAMVARTLLQQAAPTTFGLKVASWLSGLVEARALLTRVRWERIALQFGGAAGTLGALGEHGPAVASHLATELDLPLPPLPWHTNRARVAELASALAIVAGAAGNVALDVVLLSQSEVGEVREGAPGRSSAMPHKRNPARSVAILAATRRAHAIAPLLTAAMLQEHERAAGAWQAEWETVGDLFELTGAGVAHLAELLRLLEVDEAAMRRNLDASGLAGAEGFGSVQAFIDAALRMYRRSPEGPPGHREAT